MWMLFLPWNKSAIKSHHRYSASDEGLWSSYKSTPGTSKGVARPFGFKVARNHISKRTHKVQTLGKPAICMLLPQGVCTLRATMGRVSLRSPGRAATGDLFIVIMKVWAPSSLLPCRARLCPRPRSLREKTKFRKNKKEESEHGRKMNIWINTDYARFFAER